MKRNIAEGCGMISAILHIEIILYVEDQERSRSFYEALFRKKADLHVPGMTGFTLSEQSRLGLMPSAGIAKILSGKTPHPSTGSGIPRCELYLRVEHPGQELENALKAGANLISPLQYRSWGDVACYVSDPDGHIIAFAAKT